MNVVRRFNPKLIYKLRKQYVKPILITSKRYLNTQSNNLDDSIKSEQKTKCISQCTPECDKKINELKADINFTHAQILKKSSNNLLMVGGIIFFPIGMLIDPFALIGTVACFAKAGDITKHANNLIEEAEKLIEEAEKLTNQLDKKDIIDEKNN